MPSTKTKPRTINPWDAAKHRSCIRGNHIEAPAALEPGVRYFVLMLEQLGCTTHSSCEGHPAGFYITFSGPESVARAIAACGYLAVNLDGKGYKLSMGRNEWYPCLITARRKSQLLRWAAEDWTKAFGPLQKSTGPPPLLDQGGVALALIQLVDAALDVITFVDDGDKDVREGALIGLDNAVDAAAIAMAAHGILDLPTLRD